VARDTSWAARVLRPATTLTNITGNGSVITVTNSAPGVAQRFYQLVEQ
jgi:hypothetical protein